ncbi:fibronectin type III domain-containing protein [Muricauda sp. SCSIO 64092]|uniref:fibronectin type III domain-containing protein n=1 Tax=Allomuricauda sp. SCSIO 64092 TaxID=2908842 RepID=UPI001FF149D8|nr:fibronectin type III domain-containing protein [Muricauda sp. SCSIO 64092]UOY07186.1 fibronectin type III domain-containing protein [Muricauda sp. SCSIO 64092]
MKKMIIFLCLFTLNACSKSGGEDEPEIVQEPKPDSEVRNTAPTTPTTIFPTNGLLCTDNPLEFKWDPSTDKEGDAISYEIELAEDRAFNSIIEKTTVSETTVTFTLEKGVQLNWRIRAKDDNGEYSNYSSSWNFYTEGEGIANYLPFTPTLIHPKSFSKVEENNVLLEWSSSDVDGDLLYYDIYFGETTPPALIEENSVPSTHEVSVTPGKTYYWKIVVKDNNGGESIGDIWIFKS